METNLEHVRRTTSLIRFRLAMRVQSGVVTTAVVVGLLSSAPQSTGATKSNAIAARMQSFVDNGTIAGTVTLVARHARVLDVQVIGFADLETRRPMRKDNVFAIYSMTKPITATAIMILQDEGRLSLDDFVEKHLPEFKNLQPIQEQSANRVVLVPALRPITIRDLLTHSSGLGGVGNVESPRWNTSLGEMVMSPAQRPLRFVPGSGWDYCNPGLDTLGRIVEVVAGKSLPDFMAQRIFRPLGVKDTTFFPNDQQLKRLAKAYRPKEGGGLEVTPLTFASADLRLRDRTVRASGGLFSTAADICRFYQMMLNGGELSGRRILSRDTVEAMTHTQTGELQTGLTPGMSWGFGCSVVKEPQGSPACCHRARLATVVCSGRRAGRIPRRTWSAS